MIMDKESGTSFVSSIAPWLSVLNTARGVEFYKSAFGAIEVFRHEDPSGSAVSRLSIEGAEFWLNDDSSRQDNLNPGALSSESVRMILTVKDPDTLFMQALSAGASE